MQNKTYDPFDFADFIRATPLVVINSCDNIRLTRKEEQDLDNLKITLPAKIPSADFYKIYHDIWLCIYNMFFGANYPGQPVTAEKMHTKLNSLMQKNSGHPFRKVFEPIHINRYDVQNFFSCVEQHAGVCTSLIGVPLLNDSLNNMFSYSAAPTFISTLYALRTKQRTDSQNLHLAMTEAIVNCTPADLKRMYESCVLRNKNTAAAYDYFIRAQQK
ncbi:MAG: hypothetical protein FWC61_01915 [Proteobacteria bacterium]|nr:hypothetical protein [Pseudomonadota bacterium]